MFLLPPLSPPKADPLLRFKSKLPDICKLFRSKIFPNSPFSSSSRSTSPSSRATSPEVPKTSKLNVNSSRHPSPALSNVSSDTNSKTRPLERSRSRSLSVSLAQERERERERSMGLGATKKRVLNREVSMSRVFKPKPKAQEQKANSTKRKKPTDDHLAPINLKMKDEGVTLVDDTPVKPKAGEKSRSMSRSQSQMTIGDGGKSASNARAVLSQPLFHQIQGDDDDDEWRLSSLPDTILLSGRDDAPGSSIGGITQWSDGDDDVDDTPSKKKRARLR